MKDLRIKLKKQGGFTMVELLIVVAIIAILVAVSIPMMNSVLEKSRHAVDQANERDAVALAAMKALTDDITYTPGTGGAAATATFYYKVDGNHIGSLDITGPGVASECKCGSGHKGQTLSVVVTEAASVDEEPTITVSWAAAPSGD